MGAKKSFGRKKENLEKVTRFNSMLRKIIFFIFTLLLVMCYTEMTFAYDDQDTHPRITRKAAEPNNSQIEQYLIQNLGITNGLETEIIHNSENETIMKWFEKGSIDEDEPDCRASNHFHNPLKVWGESHLTDDDFLSNPIAWLIRTTCEEYWGWEYSDRKSNITWATGFLAPGGPKYDFSNTEPEYAPNTWDKAREYYYDALTAGSKDDRESNFALTFKAVGQVVHLLQDMSVPAHTRNDFVSHVRWNQIDPEAESWVAKSGIGSRYEYFVKIRPALVDATPVPPSFSNVKLTDFWDTDQYTWGSDPLSGTSIGLAEYTNSNFLSSTSIFKSSLDLWHYFPHPEKNSVVEYDEIINGNKRTYLRKLGEGETDGSKIGYGERIEHLARSGWFFKYLPPFTVIAQKALILDDVVYLDYAEKLLPRAVGYSAGLLDYFFRGTLEITAPDAYVYSIIDGSVTPQQFTKITAKIRNSTPDSIPGEEIQNCDAQLQNCIIQAVARYKKRTDYQPDLSTDPPTAASREPDFSYSVSESIVITSLSSTTPVEFTFDFTNSPIPVGITDLYLHVVFKGTLGNETDIAIAVGMKDLNEPDHHTVWNATDRFYLDGVLRTADEIRNDPALLSRASGQFIDPYDVTTEIAFYPSGVTPTVYNATFTPLPPGRYGRVIILIDMPTFYILIHRQSTNPPEDINTNLSFAGVTNQEIDGIFYNTQVNTFRGVIQHHWSAYARYYPYATGMSTAPWPVPAIIDPYPATNIYP